MADFAPSGTSAQTPLSSATSRPLMSLDNVRDILNGVDAGLQSLVELLSAAGAAPVSSANIKALMAPLQRQLSLASCDLNDMQLIEQTAAVHQLVQDGAVMLLAPGKLTGRFFTVNGDNALVISDENGFELRLYRDSTKNHNFKTWHPSWWRSYEDRKDMQGREWSGRSSIYITNDFGDLVEVGKEGGAA